MLVIISDLHLTDGTSGTTIREKAFRVLRQRLSDLAYDASYRKSGRYRPIKEVNLVLLGDILDIIRSSAWLVEDESLRPWGDSSSRQYIEKVREINKGILKKNSKSFKVLKGLAQEGGLTIPPGTRGGKPDFQAERLSVPVRTYYLVGNHDWFYHLKGSDYDEIRRSVVEAMGLANPAGQPFPHDPGEDTDVAEKIGKIFSEHRVFARHGDIYDSFNYEPHNGRDHSSLGDAIVVELLNRFPKQVEDELGSELPAEAVKGLREIDNVRPLTTIPAWIQGVMTSTVGDPGAVRKVKEVWDELVDKFLEVPFVKSYDKPWQWDAVDSLEIGLKISKGLSLGILTKIALDSMSKIGGGEESYSKNALKEQAFRSRRADYIIYGHTHHQEIVPLDQVFLGDRVSRQFYFNSGTWRRVFRLCTYSPEELEFLDYNVMTYLAFFKGDERKGRPYESWTGTLAADP